MLVKQTTPCSHVNWAFSELNSWTRKEGQVLPQCTPCHKYCCYLAQSQGDRANKTTNALKQQANVAELVPNLSNLSNEQALTLCSPEIPLIPFPEGSILTHLLPISCPFQVFYRLQMRPPCPDFKMPYNSRKSTRSHQRSNRPATYYHGHYFTSHTNKKKRAAWAEGTAPQALTASQIQRPGMFWNTRLNHWDLSEARTSSLKQASI